MNNRIFDPVNESNEHDVKKEVPHSEAFEILPHFLNASLISPNQISFWIENPNDLRLLSFQANTVRHYEEARRSNLSRSAMKWQIANRSLRASR